MMATNLPLIRRPVTDMYPQMASSVAVDGRKPEGAATLGSARTPAPIIVPCICNNVHHTMLITRPF